VHAEVRRVSYHRWQKLLEAQRRVQAGEAGSITWTGWLKANIRRSVRDVQKCMAIARSKDPSQALAEERATRRSTMARHREAAQVGRISHSGTGETAQTIGARETLSPNESRDEIQVAALPWELLKSLDKIQRDIEPQIRLLLCDLHQVDDSIRTELMLKLDLVGSELISCAKAIRVAHPAGKADPMNGSWAWFGPAPFHHPREKTSEVAL